MVKSILSFLFFSSFPGAVDFSLLMHSFGFLDLRQCAPVISIYLFIDIYYGSSSQTFLRPNKGLDTDLIRSSSKLHYAKKICFRVISTHLNAFLQAVSLFCVCVFFLVFLFVFFGPFILKCILCTFNPIRFHNTGTFHPSG